jgi:PAS domain-containing protein
MGEGTAAANALVQSTLLGELLEHANVGALASDSGRYIAANRYATTLTGWDREELIGRPVDDFCQRLGSGVVAMTCKNGEAIDLSYCVVDAHLAGINVRLALFWPV